MSANSFKALKKIKSPDIKQSQPPTGPCPFLIQQLTFEQTLHLFYSICNVMCTLGGRRVQLR